MARETEPLLARRPSSNASDRAEREDDLLTGRRTESSSYFSGNQWRRLRETLAFIWAFLATIGIVILAVVLQHRSVHPPPGHHHHGEEPHSNRDARPQGKRNLIFMVSDGMGPSSLSLTRSFNQFTSSSPFNTTLLLDNLLIGQSRTRSDSSLVTDSAAGATAFSCGAKTYNGAISMLPDGTPCPSVMEAAQRAGYKTGVVVTTRVTDATPACFGSHVRHREEEDSIAMQMTGLSANHSMDIILGGGRCHFLPVSERGSCRGDSSNLVANLIARDWSYASTRSDFDDLQSGHAVSLPLLGLFAPADIPFEIDRRFQNETYPSLAELAQTALTALSLATKDSEQGFFLLIEGSRIDHAGHINDPAAQVHEVLAYDAAVQTVLDFIDQSETETLMLATSDHETGGLALARQLHETYPDYLWKPDVLANATRSAAYVAHIYHQHLAECEDEKLEAFLRHTVQQNLGFRPTKGEIAALIYKPVYAVWILADMLSRRAQIGWSTHGHSAADVNIYSSVGARSPVRAGTDKKWEAAVMAKLAGNRENTDVGRFMRWWLDVEAEWEGVGRDLKEHAERSGGVREEGRTRREPHPWFDSPEVKDYERWAASQDWS